MKKKSDVRFERLYQELRRRAENRLRVWPHQTLNPTAVVHEAYLRLSKTPGLDDVTTEHFKAIASVAMRRVLLDAARRKRGKVPVVLGEGTAAVVDAVESFVQVDAAMTELGQLDEGLEKVAALTFIGGCTRSEVAKLLDVSETKVGRDLRLARAFLLRRLKN